MPHTMVRFPLCAVLLMLVAVAPCKADDDTLPESQKETLIEPCKDAGEKLACCKDGLFARQAQAVDAAFKAALAKTQPATAVLFKRDQVWFGEMVKLDAQNVEENSEERVSVSRDSVNKLHVLGDKWFEDDYKGGCDYDFNGKVVGKVFTPDDKSKNSNSIVRDHATLIVNPTDDFAAKHRLKPDGTLDPNADEAKCRRRLDISSTARLFPVRPARELDKNR